MKIRAWLLPLTLLAVTPVAAQAAPDKPAASIPFANAGGVDNWRADGDGAVYFQDQHRHWYRATLMGVATDLPFAEHIGIESGPGGTLDRFGAIVVGGQRYAFASFDRVDGPPAKHAKN